MIFSDFYGYERIRTNKESSERIGLPQIYSDILRISQNNLKISTDIRGKKSANVTKFNIGGDFRQCRCTPISSEICAARFHWGLCLVRFFFTSFITLNILTTTKMRSDDPMWDNDKDK
jgi:hypothetical protein